MIGIHTSHHHHRHHLRGCVFNYPCSLYHTLYPKEQIPSGETPLFFSSLASSSNHQTLLLVAIFIVPSFAIDSRYLQYNNFFLNLPPEKKFFHNWHKNPSWKIFNNILFFSFLISDWKNHWIRVLVYVLSIHKINNNKMSARGGEQIYKLMF